MIRGQLSDLPLTVHRLLFTVHRLLFTVHRLLFTAYCSPPTVHCLLLTVHRSLFLFLLKDRVYDIEILEGDSPPYDP